MKIKRLIFLLFLLFFISCTSERDFVKDIPLSDVKSHIDSLQLLDQSDIIETSTKYLDLLKIKKNSNRPQLYFFLHLLGNDTILQIGLEKFPDDPYLNFMKVTSMEEGDLKLSSYMKILETYPHHEITLNDLILHTMDEYNKTSNKELKQKLVLGLNKYIVKYKTVPRGVINGYDFTSSYNNIPETFSDEFRNTLNVVSSLIDVTLQKIEKERLERLEELSRSPVGKYKWDNLDFNGYKEGENILNIKRDGTWVFEYTNTSVYPRVVKTKSGTWETKVFNGLIRKSDRSVVPEKESVSLIKFSGDEQGILQYFKQYKSKRMMLWEWDNPTFYHNFNDQSWSRGRNVFLIGYLNSTDVLRLE